MATPITAERTLAKITDLLAQRHATSVETDLVRRSLQTSKTALGVALNELEAGGYVVHEADLGVVSLRGDDAFDVEPAQSTLPLGTGVTSPLEGDKVIIPTGVGVSPYLDENGHDVASDDEEIDEITEVVSYDDLPESPAIDEDLADDDEGDDEEDRPSRTIVPAKYRAKYKATRNTCGDDLAYAITDFVNSTFSEPRKDGKGSKKVRALSLTALAMLASDNGIEPDAIKGNNNGQKRMNLSNMLRGMLRAGKDVTVDGVVFPGHKPTFTKADWLKATADGYMTETGCTRPQAKAQAEEEWEIKTAGGYEFDPATGELFHD